jgi:hypothetical protein
LRVKASSVTDELPAEPSGTLANRFAFLIVGLAVKVAA